MMTPHRRRRNEWSFDLPGARFGKHSMTVPTGEQVRIPIAVKLPQSTLPGTYQLRASFKFSSGVTQEDSFDVHVLPLRKVPHVGAKIALFDPPGETAALLKMAGIAFQSVDAAADLGSCTSATCATSWTRARAATSSSWR